MKPPVQQVESWTWWRVRLVRQRHRGTFRSTTWHLVIGWGATWPGLSGVEVTWRHRNVEGGSW